MRPIGPTKTSKEEVQGLEALGQEPRGGPKKERQGAKPLKQSLYQKEEAASRGRATDMGVDDHKLCFMVLCPPGPKDQDQRAQAQRDVWPA